MDFLRRQHRLAEADGCMGFQSARCFRPPSEVAATARGGDRARVRKFIFLHFRIRFPFFSLPHEKGRRRRPFSVLPAGSSRAYRPGTTLPPALSQGTFQNAGCRRRPSGTGAEVPCLPRPGAVGSLISPCNYRLPAGASREQLLLESFFWGPARLFLPRAPRTIFLSFIFFCFRSR